MEILFLNFMTMKCSHEYNMLNHVVSCRYVSRLKASNSCPIINQPLSVVYRLWYYTSINLLKKWLLVKECLVPIFTITEKDTHYKKSYTLFYISNTFISNARLKMAKIQENAKQHPEAELLLFENYSHSSYTISCRNNRTYSKKLAK